MKIAEIRDILKQDDVPDEVMKEILADSRKGVQQLVSSYMRRLERESRERLRVESLYEVESEFYKRGLTHVVGIDEVGRGPLAGPVTVAAVILKPHWFAEGLNDSKKVTPKHREVLAEKIHREAVEVSIVSLPPEEIDALNIYQATMTAMYQAVRNLHVKPDAVIVDAMPLHFHFLRCPWCMAMPGVPRWLPPPLQPRYTGIISWMRMTNSIRAMAFPRTRAMERRNI